MADTINKDYSEMTGEELRELALTSGDAIHGELSEEDYTAVIDFELSLQNPDSRVMAFCHKGLCKFEAYGKETDKLDISELIKRAGLSAEGPDGVRTFSIMDFKKRNLARESLIDRNARILKTALQDRLHDTYEKEGITFLITNAGGLYNLAWLNKSVLYNIDSRMSLDDVNGFIGSYAA